MNRLTKEIIKNVFYVGIILFFASISTFLIYNKFQNTRDVDISSKSLDVVYHDSSNKISITKAVPVSDSVGLSSNAYNLSIKNNLTVPVKYLVKIVEDEDFIINNDKVIPREDIRVSIKANKYSNDIYNLDELEDGILLDTEIGALEKNDLSIRLWINKHSNLSNTNDIKYQAFIKVIEID